MRHFTLTLVASEIGDDGRQWIEVMPTADQAKNGRFRFTITREDLELFAEHIRANPERIPVDYDHARAEGGSTVAAGWFTGQAEVREVDGEPRLYAEVEWTPEGRKDVESKRYRFISPEWSMEKRDEKTGLMTKAKALLAATLTNRPFFTQLAPVASDEAVVDPGNEPEEEGNMDELRAALGLPEDATEEQILAAVKTAKEASDQLATIESRRKRGNKGGTTVNAALAEALGLPADVDEATVIAAARRAAEDSDQLSEMKDEFGKVSAEAATARQLEARIKVLEAERSQERVDRILADGVRQGRVAPSEKQTLSKLFAARPSELEDLIASRPEGLFRLAPKGFGGEGMEAGEDSIAIAEEFSSEHADGVDPDSARLHAAALKQLRADGVNGEYTDAQYAKALDKASRALA